MLTDGNTEIAVTRANEEYPVLIRKGLIQPKGVAERSHVCGRGGGSKEGRGWVAWNEMY